MEALSGRAGVKCGRWNPTAEQVKVLTELFRAGLRTPSTEQIQRISTHLSAFGKVESKNVFYWFQNHKARERHHHKKRRRGASSPSPSPSPSPDSGSNDEYGGSRAGAAADLVLQPPAESKQREATTRSYGGHHHHRLAVTCNKQQQLAAAHISTTVHHAGYFVVRDEEEAMWPERPTREVETLELFPLKSYVDLELEAAAAEKQVRYVRGSAASEQCREFSFFDVSGGRDPPLELRLCSFGPY